MIYLQLPEVTYIFRFPLGGAICEANTTKTLATDRTKRRARYISSDLWGSVEFSIAVTSVSRRGSSIYKIYITLLAFNTLEPSAWLHSVIRSAYQTRLRSIEVGLYEVLGREQLPVI